MEIRQLRQEEFEASLTLSEYAFQYKMSGEARESAKRRFRPERVWGAFEGNQLEAKFSLLPLEIYVQGEPVRMGGIAGVATWPENRRQGLVARLLTHALEHMNQEGITVSCLHPFFVPFYRKFGWEVYCDQKKYRIPVDKLPAKETVPGKIVRDVEDVELLDRLYQKYAAAYNGTLRRDKEWWAQSVLEADEHNVVFFAESGEPEGYILYKVEKREFTINELVYRTEQARRALWTFVANHDSMIDAVSITFVPANDILPYLLPDPRGVKQETHPYFMARIVNIQSFAQRLRFTASGSAERWTIGLADRHAPWNNGTWECRIDEEGQSVWTRLESGGEAPELSCDIGAMTAMLLGYKRPAELYRFGILTGDASAAECLERRVPQAATALFDFF